MYESALICRYAQGNFFNKIKAGLGLDRCVTLAYGAAPLATDVSLFFMGMDMRLIDVYGLSETAGLTLGQLDTTSEGKFFKFGSVGQGIPCIHTRVADADSKGEGDLLINARSVMMGYLNA